MDKNKKDYPVTVKINGDDATVHLSINDIIESFYSMSDEVCVYVITKVLNYFTHTVHKAIAKKMNLKYSTLVQF